MLIGSSYQSKLSSENYYVPQKKQSSQELNKNTETSDSKNPVDKKLNSAEDPFLKKEIDKLAEKIKTTFSYSQTAAKVIASNMLQNSKFEFVA